MIMNNTKEIYNKINNKEEFPKELKEYERILKIIFKDTIYNRDMDNIILSLALITKEDNIILEYLSKEKNKYSPKLFEKVVRSYASIYDTRIEHFSFNDDCLIDLINIFKEEVANGNVQMSMISHFLIGVSTNYQNVFENYYVLSPFDNIFSANYVVSFFIDEIVLGKISKDFFDKNNKSNSFYNLNKELSSIFFDCYDKIAEIKTELSNCSKSVSINKDQVANTIMFFKDLITFYLLNQDRCNSMQIARVFEECLFFTDKYNCLRFDDVYDKRKFFSQLLCLSEKEESKSSEKKIIVKKKVN